MPALRARAVLVGQVPTVFAESILANALFGLRRVLRAQSSSRVRMRGLPRPACGRGL